MQRPQSTSPTAPLLALVNATAEWHAGLPGVCSASVRLLDRVHFTVHRRDCIVVQHDDPASARVLLAALGGHAALPPGRRLRGERQCAPGVRVRRCSIPVDAVAALQSGWADLTGRSPNQCRAPHDHQPVVHLLRASRSAALSTEQRHAWHRWAKREREAGGAVVIVAPVQSQPATVTSMPPRRLDALREQVAAPYEAHDVVRARAGEGGRALWLRHGRLINLRTWE